MAVNITIQEDGVAKNFSADKIRTNTTGGDSVEWVPSTEGIEDATGHKF